jgi:DNA polymerase-3 subunit alpha
VSKQGTTQARLFKTNHRKFNLPTLNTTFIEEAYDQTELLGFPLCNYFDLMDDACQQSIKASELNTYINQNVLLYGVLVNTRFHKASNGKLLRFCTFVDREGHYFDTVHFTKVVDKFPIHGIGVYACYGKVTEEFDFCSLDIIWSKKMTLKPDPRSQ